MQPALVLHPVCTYSTLRQCTYSVQMHCTAPVARPGERLPNNCRACLQLMAGSSPELAIILGSQSEHEVTVREGAALLSALHGLRCQIPSRARQRAICREHAGLAVSERSPAHCNSSCGKRTLLVWRILSWNALLDAQVC